MKNNTYLYNATNPDNLGPFGDAKLLIHLAYIYIYICIYIYIYAYMEHWPKSARLKKNNKARLIRTGAGLGKYPILGIWNITFK